MADESRGTDAGVSLTPIYVDDKGRRRRGDVEAQNPNNLDPSSKIDLLVQQMAQMQSDMSNLKNELQTAKSDLAGMIITGPGFSGSGPKGIQFSPSMTVQAQCDPDNPGTITGTVTLT